MIKRRTFLKTTSKAVLATTILPITNFSCVLNRTSKVRFGLLSDSHYAERAPKGTRFYRNVLDKMNEAVAICNAEKVDFIIHLGDFKDEDERQQKHDTLQYLKAIEQSYSQFNGPRYHCIGNHDVDSITKTEFLNHITNTGIAKTESYYAFVNSGFKFIVLDANYDAQGNDHYYKQGSDWQDTNITPKQLQWLTHELHASTIPVVIFCHHPLFEFFRDGHKYHINNYKQVQDVLNASKSVIACFQGHVHEERFVKINQTHYVTQLGMVDYEGIDNNSFSIVEIDNNNITIKGYKRASNKQLV